MLRARAALAPKRGPGPWGHRHVRRPARGAIPLVRRGHVLLSAWESSFTSIQPLLGSHGSLQTFDNEAKYT